MTKLQAVNEMLEAVGLPAVAALDTGGTSEEGEAEATLDREVERILSRGWACNTIEERTFAPVTNIISMVGVLNFSGSKFGQHYVIQHGRLIDPVNDKTTFTESVTLTNVVLLLTWDQIPQHVQQYIIASAVLSFVRYKRQDVQEDRRYAAKLVEAKSHAQTVDARQQDVNITETFHAYQVRGFPYGRRR